MVRVWVSRVWQIRGTIKVQFSKLSSESPKQFPESQPVTAWLTPNPQTALCSPQWLPHQIQSVFGRRPDFLLYTFYEIAPRVTCVIRIEWVCALSGIQRALLVAWVSFNCSDCEIKCVVALLSHKKPYLTHGYYQNLTFMLVLLL